MLSPTAFRGDPVRYMTALLGEPIDKESNGEFGWKSDTDRFHELNRAIESWCADNGGTYALRSQNWMCRDKQGQAIARLWIGNSPTAKGDVTFIRIEPQDLARRNDNQRQQRVDAHNRYVSSNGAVGSITLVDGRRFSVLRFGSTEYPIDYVLQGKNEDRPLRDVRSLRRTSPAGDRTPETFDVRFADGTSTTGTHLLTNSFDYLNENRQLSKRRVTLAGLSSNQMILVVRNPGQAGAMQVRIRTREIAEIQIDSIDQRPVTRIHTQGNSATKLESDLQARWARAVAGKPSARYYRQINEGPNWCHTVEHGTTESSLICRKLLAEHELAARTGLLTPQTTPATLAGEGLTELANRTLM